MSEPQKCQECGGDLGKDFYRRSPRTGRTTPARAWCSKCFERLAAGAKPRPEINPYFTDDTTTQPLEE